MPRIWNYNVDDKVLANDKAERDIPGVTTLGVGTITEKLVGAIYDYVVKFKDGTEMKFKEDELVLVPKVSDAVELIHTGEKGIIVRTDYDEGYYEVSFNDGSYKVHELFEIRIIKRNEKGSVQVEQNEQGYFQELGNKVGELVDLKQKAYGDSVSKTYKLMQIYLDQYDNGDGTYTIPKSLLKHILLQVRKIDKANRIFSNPDGDLMGENPYQDDVGYSLLGMRMVENEQ